MCHFLWLQYSYYGLGIPKMHVLIKTTSTWKKFIATKQTATKKKEDVKSLYNLNCSQ